MRTHSTNHLLRLNLTITILLNSKTILRDNIHNRTRSQECSNNTVSNHTRDRMLATVKKTFQMNCVDLTNSTTMMISSLSFQTSLLAAVKKTFQMNCVDLTNSMTLMMSFLSFQTNRDIMMIRKMKIIMTQEINVLNAITIVIKILTIP